MTLGSRATDDPKTLLGLIDSTQALAEFTPRGEIIAANANFLKLVGYALDEVRGAHHRIFVDPLEAASPTYADFWAARARGESVTGEFRRIGKNGRTLCIVASYGAVRDRHGQVERVVTICTDVTQARLEAQNAANLLENVARSQAVIEFTPQGQIVTANDNALKVLGYTLDEVRGRHHRMFVDPVEAASPAYAAFWAALGRGESQTGEFGRIDGSGAPVFLVATYTAVLDPSGKVQRVVKFATDVTALKLAVDSLVYGLGRMAEGDLTARVERHLSGGFAHVAEVFNRSAAAFGAMVDEVRALAGTMNEEAGAIAHDAEDLARRGESQAAALEQTAAAIEEISGNVALTSQSARDADTAARAAQTIVASGAEIVSNAIAAMERIDEHTRNMAEFTRVIENFAFQTNLLSINAAVEAARAGEVGRGFAVVANEVRNLAQQSARASQSIAGLIGQSEAEVTTGVRLVREAGAALDQIRDAVGAMVMNIAGIAHATSEEATGTREVSEALSQLDGVNQSNLALSDRNAAAAASMSAQATELMQRLSRFHTEAAPLPARRVA